MRKEKNRASEYPLEDKDVKALVNATETTRNKVIIELLAFTACRREELVLLRIKDINLELEQINMPTVKQEPRSKGDKERSKAEKINTAYEYARRIPIINNDLKRDIKTLMAEMAATKNITPTNRLIQSRQSDSMTCTMINIIVARVSDAAGITSPNPERKHVHPHMLRHTFVRYAQKMEVSPKIIQQMLGHSSINTTFDMYGKPTWEDRKDELKKMKEYGLS